MRSFFCFFLFFPRDGSSIVFGVGVMAPILAPLPVLSSSPAPVALDCPAGRPAEWLHAGFYVCACFAILRVCLCGYFHLHLCTCVSCTRYVHTRMFMCVFVCVLRVCLCVILCVCVCVCVFFLICIFFDVRVLRVRVCVYRVGPGCSSSRFLSQVYAPVLLAMIMKSISLRVRHEKVPAVYRPACPSCQPLFPAR